jgi:hypothetical protein
VIFFTFAIILKILTFALTYIFAFA